MFDTNALKTWFVKEMRSLPWRDHPSPYAVWVSEIMLQQTQVAVVIPYFIRWMQLFPSISQLAEASPKDVIKAWEGLGYYSRVRNLHEGARFVVKYFEGRLPSNEKDLKKIKGLGNYTIGAIRSFAFHEKTPAVDGNVLRVLARYFKIEEEITKPKVVRKIWDLAAAILPNEDSWVINEALIELGAMVCGRKPKCGKCPIRNGCQAYLQGLSDVLPNKPPRAKIQLLHRAVAVIVSEGHCLLKRCPEGEIMGGLYEFPYLETTSEGLDEEMQQLWLKQSFGLEVRAVDSLPEVRHSFTRFRARLFPYLFSCNNRVEVSDFQWVSLAKIDQLPFSSGHRRISLERVLKV